MSPERLVTYVSGMDHVNLAASEGLEPPTPSLGRRASWSACVYKTRANLVDINVLN